MYTEEVLKRFKKPRFVGEIKNADAIGEVGNFKCGDTMRIYLKVKDDKIKDIKFLTYGCVAAIASTDMVCELVKGKSIDEAYNLNNWKIVKGLKGMPPVKVHCSILGIRALRDAIEKYKKLKIEKDKQEYA